MESLLLSMDETADGRMIEVDGFRHRQYDLYKAARLTAPFWIHIAQSPVLIEDGKVFLLDRAPSGKALFLSGDWSAQVARRA